MLVIMIVIRSLCKAMIDPHDTKIYVLKLHYNVDIFSCISIVLFTAIAKVSQL